MLCALCFSHCRRVCLRAECFCPASPPLRFRLCGSRCFAAHAASAPLRSPPDPCPAAYAACIYGAPFLCRARGAYDPPRRRLFPARPCLWTRPCGAMPAAAMHPAAPLPFTGLLDPCTFKTRAAVFVFARRLQKKARRSAPSGLLFVLFVSTVKAKLCISALEHAPSHTVRTGFVLFIKHVKLSSLRNRFYSQMPS